MHTEVTVVLVQSLQGGDVRCSFYYLIHPLDGPYHLVALFLSEDRRTLVLGDLSFERSKRYSIVIFATFSYLSQTKTNLRRFPITTSSWISLLILLLPFWDSLIKWKCWLTLALNSQLSPAQADKTDKASKVSR